MPLPNTFAAASLRGYGGFNFRTPSDPNFSSVSLLLPGNGTNGAQNNTFLDGSANNFTITRNGNTTQGSFSPFAPASGSAWSAATNGGSGYFDGSGDYFTVPDNAAFDFGNGNFTIEMWVYPTAVGQSGLTLLYCKPNGSGYSGIAIGQAVGGYGAVIYASSNGTSWNLASGVSAGTMTANAWNHVAVTRSGTNIYGFVGGVLGSTTAVSTTALVTTTTAVSLGSSAGTANTFLTGYMSNARVVKGTAVYTSSFTPPTAPLTAITNTSLLLNFTNAAIYDAAAKNDLETAGNAQISTTQSKWGGSSMYFDGTGDWLFGADNTALQLGTGTFTVEGWVYRNASGTYGLVGKGTSTTGWLVSLNASNQIVFTFDTSAITSVGTVAATTWTHIAVVREGTGANQTKIYISGTNDGTGTVSNNFNQTNPIYVGADRTGGSAANAYLQDLRITKGVARYTSNFTPPTAPFPVR